MGDRSRSRGSDESPAKTAKTAENVDMVVASGGDGTSLPVAGAAVLPDFGAGAKQSGDNEALDPATAAAIQSLVDDAMDRGKKEITAGVQKTFASMLCQQQQDYLAKLDEYSAAIGKKFDDTVGKITDQFALLQTRVAQLESSPTPVHSPAASESGGESTHSAAPRSFLDVARGSGSSSVGPGASFVPFPTMAPTPPSFQLKASPLSNEWDRATDPSVLKMVCIELVSDKEFRKLAHQVLLTAAVTMDKVELEISVLAKDATIRFKGDERTYRRGVKQVLDSFRTADKVYTRHTVRNPEGQEIPCFINPDKSRKDVRSEIACKKMRLLLESKYTNKDTKSPPFEWKRLGSVVCTNWQNLARFFAHDSETYEWKWDRPKAATLGIDTKAMEELFESDFGAGSATVWT